VTQCTCLSDSPLPENVSFWKSIAVAPHTLPTCGVNWLFSNNIYVQFTCVTIYYLAVSELLGEGFSWKFLSWTQRSFRIPQIENNDVGVWLYWCYTIWQLHIYFLYKLFWKHSSQFSSIDVTPFILRWWRILCAECGTVWNGFGEWVCSRWLCGGCVCVCVCVSASFELE